MPHLEVFSSSDNFIYLPDLICNVNVKLHIRKRIFIIQIVVILGTVAFAIFLAPAFLPDISKKDFYPVLTNIMGLCAIAAGLLFIYWAYRVSREVIRHGKPRTASTPFPSALSATNVSNPKNGEYIFCTECELIEGKANICKTCPKYRDEKNAKKTEKSF
ncbi:MAG: hypothetical protein ACP5LE_05150 [Thermoplasmata archaeon]